MTFNSSICFTPGEQMIKNCLESTSRNVRYFAPDDFFQARSECFFFIRCLLNFPTINSYIASFGVNEQNVTLVVRAAALSAGVTRKFSTRQAKYL